LFFKFFETQINESKVISTKSNQTLSQFHYSRSTGTRQKLLYHVTVSLHYNNVGWQSINCQPSQRSSDFELINAGLTSN